MQPGEGQYGMGDARECERAIIDAARDLVGLWQAQKISGASRSERNAAIEETRQRLIKAIESSKREPEKTK